jgi:hypothetical protein
MTETEIKEMEKAMDEFSMEILSNKENQIKFLQSIGVLNKKGRVRKEYKHLQKKK